MGSPAIGSRSLDKTISEALRELALDLRWSFNHSADHLWERLDPELWELTHNPWIILQTISQEKLESVAADADFQTLVADLHREKQTAAPWRLVSGGAPAFGPYRSGVFLHGIYAD